MEEGKGEDGDGENDGHALAVWESEWRDMSIIVINPSQNISHRDWTPLLVVT